MRVVLFSLVMILFSLSLLWPGEVKAEERARPAVELRAHLGASAYRSSGCPCFDRYLRSYFGGLTVQFHRFFGVDGEYLHQTMVFPEQAELPVRAVGLGVRSALTPRTERWWGGFYGRVGYQILWAAFTRQRRFHGAYGGLGFQHGVGIVRDHLRLEYEIPMTVVGGALSHSTVGVRGGMVLRW